MTEKDKQALLDSARQSIIQNFRGIDNTFKLKKGSSLCRLLFSSDSLKISEASAKLNDVIDHMINNELKGKVHQLTWLQNNLVNIRKNFNSYLFLKDYTFFIEDDFVEYAMDFDINDFADKTLSAIENFSIVYNGVFYYVMQGNLVVMDKVVESKNTYQLSVMDLSGVDLSCTYALEGTITVNRCDMNLCNVMCSNRRCPRYRESYMMYALENGRKHCGCSLSDTENCKAFGVVLTPSQLTKVVQALLLVFQNRSNLSAKTSLKKSDIKFDERHEPIPSPENMNPVIVYFGRNSKILSVEALVARNSTVSGSHASPRQHYRRGTNVREYSYINKRGTEITVSAHPRKGGVVNEGQTKCSYELRRRK